MALNPGETLNNHQYQIVRFLARGGFGFVYEAQDTLLGEPVAIKELIPALVGDETLLKRFLTEAKATIRLTHDQIVRTHNVFREGENYYIVMEYMSGGSLETRLKEGGPMDPEESVRIVAEICQGLAYAHAQGVVHCDLKPANILFDANGNAHVADFGIAHVSGDMVSRNWQTADGFVAGTLPYMSPEQTAGQRDDPRIDIYALGAILYRMVTGHTYLEFDTGETPLSQSENVQRIFKELPKPPKQLNPLMPDWLGAVVLKALEKEPAKRYPSAHAMRAELIQQGPRGQRGPITPTPTTPPPQRPSPAPIPVPQGTPRPAAVNAPAKKKSGLPGWFWLIAALAALLLVGLVIGGGGLLMGWFDTEPTATVAVITAVASPTATLPPTSTDVPTAGPSATSTPTATPIPTATETPIPTPQAGATRVWQDNSVMVFVPEGPFLMGSNNAQIDAVMAECPDCDREAFEDEQPRHEVTLDAFWIDSTEVSNDQFRQCVEAGICEAPTTCDFGNPTYNEEGMADHPVQCVDWSQAVAYCAWADKRLPTEAEWEKAARGPDGLIYPWGNEFVGSLVNFCDVNCRLDTRDEGWDDGYAFTAPIGSYPLGASPYGALDMAGNRYEWTADRYDADYYDVSPDSNPPGPDSGSAKVMRGGAQGSSRFDVRAAARREYDPNLRSNRIGFRCAVSP